MPPPSPFDHPKASRQLRLARGKRLGLLLLMAMASTGRSAPLVFSSAEALRAHVNQAWTNSFSATILPPGCAFFHDLGVLAYDTGFPSGFFAGCEPILQDGIPMHAVEVTETNDVTRVWRCPGAEIGQFPVPADYNAEAWALQRFPLPPYLDEPARAARLAEAKLGGRQTLRLRLISQASIPAYLASLATRVANRPAQIGTNDIGAVSTRLLPGGQEVEVLVHAPGDVGKIGVYQAPELTAHPDWTFQGFAVRLDNPVAFQVALDVQRRYILFANHQRDSDGDRLPDAYEELITGTQSDRLDTDFDGLSDWDEICLHMTSATSADTDGDGRSDALEIELGLNPRQGEPTTDTDWDGDGLREELELLLGSNPHAFDPAPNLNLRHEAKTRTVVLTKFGFRPFQTCADCTPPKEQFYLRGIFTETGLTNCPGGDRTNSTATATVSFSPFGEPQVSETITGVDGDYAWTRPPLSYLDPRLCNPGTVQTNERADQLWKGEEHYLYTAAPCPEQPSTHTLELSQRLQIEYTDALLVAWASLFQQPGMTQYPSDWNDTITRTYTGSNPPRVSNVSDLHLSSQSQEVWDLQGCPDFTVVRLEENEHSLASRWVAKGAEPENLEVIALRDSKTRVAQDPEEPVAPMLQSISTLEYHVPADDEGGTAYLVGRRTFRKAAGGTVYARDNGMVGTEEPKIKTPPRPGQVFVVPDPIQVRPVDGVQTIVQNQYLMLWGNGPSTTAVFQVSLNDSLAGVDWQTVPGTTVGLRVQGPAGGVNATLGGQPLAFGPATFGPATGLYVPAEFSLAFTQPGSYTFAATLEGPNVLGETRLVVWQIRVVAPKIEILSIEVTSDFEDAAGANILKTSPEEKFSMVGAPFPEPEWVKGIQNHPTLHAMNTFVAIKAKMKIQPAGIHMLLRGESAVGCFQFQSANILSNGQEQEIFMTGASATPLKICVVESVVNWTATIQETGSQASGGQSGPHQMLLTFGRPFETATRYPNSSTYLRAKKMCGQIAVDATSEDQAASKCHQWIKQNIVFQDSADAWSEAAIWGLLDGVGNGQCHQGGSLMDFGMRQLGVNSTFEHVKASARLPVLFSTAEPVSLEKRPNSDRQPALPVCPNGHGTEKLIMLMNGEKNEGEGSCRVGTKVYPAFVDVVGEDVGTRTAEHHLLYLLKGEYGLDFQRWIHAGSIDCGDWAEVPPLP